MARHKQSVHFFGPSRASASPSRPIQYWQPNGFLRAVIVLTGLVIPQVILYGPSLIGRKILLPVDILAMPGVYLPRDGEFAEFTPENRILSDLIFQAEVNRQFAAKEFRAGRLPIWSPNFYSGAPFAFFPKYSPFNVVYYLFPSPYSLVWIQLVTSVLGGVGAYVFFRRILEVSFWPASVGAWCFPLTGSFILWQGYPLPAVTAWLGWILWATHRVVRRPNGKTGVTLALLTGLVIVSGKVDVAAQVLLVSGLYAVWCLLDQGLRWPRPGRKTDGVEAGRSADSGSGSFDDQVSMWANMRGFMRSTIAVSVAWLLGILLASPFLFPLLEYSKTGSRIQNRIAGTEERPPIGMTALPLVVLPFQDGYTWRGSLYVGKAGNNLESASTAYTGLVVALFAAPLAFLSRKHVSVNLFWLALGVIGLAWTLNVPLLVTALRLPIMNMMSHNRLVFATSFAILALAVVGLQVLLDNQQVRRWWTLVPTFGIVVLLGWCLYRATHHAEPMASQVERAMLAGQPIPGIPDTQALEGVKRHFSGNYAFSAVLCLTVFCAWLCLLFAANVPTWLPPLLAAIVLVDLMWFAYGQNPQCDPVLYYPEISVLKKIADAEPGRILGIRCLPPNLAITHGLRDIRGYDGVDSRRYLQLLESVKDEKLSASPPYAKTQYFVPQLQFGSDHRIKCPPIVNMLNVRYLIVRSALSGNRRMWLNDDDYWVLENEGALPRVYVPRRVETLVGDETKTGEETLLNAMRNVDFNPRRVAFVEQEVNVPDRCLGSAQIVDEIPNRVTIEVDMQTPGMVVLADRWDTGWRASIDGQPVPIIRTNYVLRGVITKRGKSTIEFRYQPASLRRGFQCLAAGVFGLVIWGVGPIALGHRTKQQKR